MLLNQKVIFTAVGLALLISLAVAANLSPARPRAQVTETVHQFDTATEDQTRSHTFVIRNTGHKPLEITRVEADCACTAMEYDKVIPPDGQGRMTLGIKPFSLQGAFAKKTTVSLNDPDQPTVIFTLQGVNLPLVDIQPGHIIRLKGRPGEELHHQVRLTSNFPEPWKIDAYRTTYPEYLNVDIKAVEAGKSYLVEVRQKRQEPGRYDALVELLTNIPKRPKILLRVFVEVLPL
jgi:hypothetical protein